MKASELIAKLNNIMSEHGDQEVIIDQYESMGHASELNNVEFVKIGIDEFIIVSFKLGDFIDESN